EEGSDDVGGVGVEASNRSSHSTTNVVLLDVKFDEVVHRAFKNAFDDIAWDNGAGNNTLTTALDPVNSSWLLVGTIISRDRDNRHILKAAIIRHNRKRVLNTLGDHVHAHGITSSTLETNVQSGTSKSSLDAL